jgi:DNA polymerase V
MRVEKLDWRAEGPLWLPYFDGRVPAGFPSPAEDYLEVPLDLNEYLVENKAATFLMRVDGDSMEQAGILDGDLLIVDRSARPISGSIVVVAVNGEYTVKRLRVAGEQVWLDPANPRYKPLSIATGEELHVFGVVRHAIHTVR